MEALSEKLIFLADKYETPDFLKNDPSQFLRWYSPERVSDVEIASFIAAMLSFGSRTQFIPKIRQILELSDQFGGICNWILNGSPKFPHGSQKFYRFYSFDDLHIFFEELRNILKINKNLGEFFKIKEGEVSPSLQPPSAFSANPSSGENSPQRPLDLIISNAFPNSKIVPKGKNSANKRIHMFLRWMVRQNSPVDIGIWNWYSPSNLLIPLDVHVMHESVKLGLLSPSDKATRKTAQKLTEKMKAIFPEDPVRADYALFGLGISFD